MGFQGGEPAIVPLMRIAYWEYFAVGFRMGAGMRRRKTRRNQVLRLAITVDLFLW